MSIDIMNRLWWRDFSPELEALEETYPGKYPGSEKNLHWTLVTMADSADETGFCWPAISTVALKSRLSSRAVQMSIAQAVAIGVLRRRDRLNTSTQFLFMMEKLPHVARPARTKERGPIDHFEEAEPDLFTGAGDSPLPLQGVRGTGAGDSLTGAPDAPGITTDSSRNHQSPSDEALCAFVVEQWEGLIVDYPDLAGFGSLTNEKARAIVLRTNEHVGKRSSDLARRGLWEIAFGVIRSSKLLLGMKTEWSVTIDWLLTKKNFRKVVERQYGNGNDRVGTAGRGDRSSVDAGRAALDIVRGHRQRSDRRGDQPAG